MKVVRALRLQPLRRKRRRLQVVHCDSGTRNKTTPGKDIQRLEDCEIQRREIFICSHAVNIQRLLGFVLDAIMSLIYQCGGNTLVDEYWSYTIQQYTRSPPIFYEVTINYRGQAAKHDSPGASSVISFEGAEGISGLMTIMSRKVCINSSKYQL